MKSRKLPKCNCELGGYTRKSELHDMTCPVMEQSSTHKGDTTMKRPNETFQERIDNKELTSLAPDFKCFNQKPKTQHTPGPWMVSENSLLACGKDIIDTKGDLIARTLDARDARLIAAAPELLELLKVIEKEVMLNDIRPLPWLDDVTSLIVKAEGRIS